MGFLDEFRSHHDEVASSDSSDLQKHDDSKVLDLASGAAAFAAMKAFENHKAKNVEPPSHQMAKEIFAALAAAEVAKLMQTKGADWVDKEKAEHQAKEKAKRLYDEQYAQ